MSRASSGVHIVTDSTSDLTNELIGDLPITVVPLSVDVNGTIYRDRVDLTNEEFVRFLRADLLPRTSQPSIGAFQETYEPILAAGQNIVSIHIAHQLSGTWNSATQAARAIGEHRIHVVDSGTVS